MQFALNHIDERIKPVSSGQEAKCPLCRGIVIGKCGEIYRKHWQHKSIRNCDTWQEHETDWHIQWKKKFQENWQEVIIERNGEKHIADVLTSGGLVIEFQNSPISSTTIRTREVFYDNMIWVVNADTFKENFHITSDVHTLLRSVEKEAKRKLSIIESKNLEQIKPIEDKILDLDKLIPQKLNRIKVKDKTILEIKEICADIKKLVDSWLRTWMLGNSVWLDHTGNLIEKLASRYKAELGQLYQGKVRLQNVINAKNNYIRYLNNLKDYDLYGEKYKIHDPIRLPKSKYSEIKAISISDSFFPEEVNISSEYEFNRFIDKKEKYIFLIKPDSIIQSAQQENAEANSLMEELNVTLNGIRKEIESIAIPELTSLIKTSEYERSILNRELNEMRLEMNRLKDEYEKAKNDIEILNTNAKDKIEHETGVKKSEIMNNEKGNFTYYWLHERMTWSSASKPIFFDFGENYLFKKVSDGKFKKIQKDEFIRIVGIGNTQSDT